METTAKGLSLEIWNKKIGFGKNVIVPKWNKNGEFHRVLNARIRLKSRNSGIVLDFCETFIQRKIMLSYLVLEIG